MKMSKTAGRLVRAATAPLFLVAALTATPAAIAEEPMSVTSVVTDSTGSVDVGEVESALNEMQDKTGKSLRVVLVDDFGSRSSDTWAGETFRKSGLGKTDALIAIATQTRQYSIHANESGGWTQSELQDAIDSSVTSEWRNGNWQAGIEKLADNITKANTTNWTGIAVGVGGVAAAGAAAIGGIKLYRRRKKKQAQAVEAESLEALAKRASQQLLHADDGVRSAAAELEFARAEFGMQATQQFADALATAQDAIQKAFVIRQELYDDIPETPAQTKRMNERILELAKTANDSLATQEEEFRKLRDLSARADSYLDELEARAEEIDSQREVYSAQIDALALSHGEQAIATLRTYPDQIATFTQSARSSIASGRERIAQGNRTQAVPYTRLAEEALAHAAKRVEEIQGAREALDQGMSKVRQALASISSDVEDAKRLGGGDQAIAARQADAERLIAAYSRGNVDPLKALSELATAEDALDAALAGVRSEEERRQREDVAADRNRSLASAKIDEVNRYIGQYAHYIDNRTRSLLASARANLAEGNNSASPAERASRYQLALSRASEAESRAREDIDRATRHRYRNYDFDDRRDGGSGFGGMLAGMVIGSLLSGGGNRSNDFGGFDFGGFGGFDFGGGGGGGGGDIDFGGSF